MKQDLLIIDGSSYIFRAYYGIRPLTTKNGIPTNATFGFVKMILKLITEFNPKYMAMVFDSPGKNFRHELYPEYKANRETPPEDLISQIPYIYRVTEVLNIPMFKLQGFEADDIIATLALKEKNNFKVTIISSDKDLMQLIDEDITMYDPMRDKTYDEKTVKEKMGVVPSLIHDFLAITGDSSDNIPGVAKIGPKGAAELLKQFGSLEKIYENINQVVGTKRELLLESKENAFLSKKLTTLKIDTPIKYTKEDLELKPVNDKLANELFTELELKSVITSLKIDERLSGQESEITYEEEESTLSRKKYHTVFTQRDFEALLIKLKNSSMFAFDTETTSLEARKAKLVGLSFSFNENEAYYVPIGHSYINVPEQLNFNFVLEKLKPILEDESLKKIGQNLKYDIIVLKNYAIEVKNIYFDTMIASYVINPNLESHSLDNLSLLYLNHETIKYSDVAGKGKTQIPFYEIEISKASEYACEDADCTYRIFKILEEKIHRILSKNIFFDIEMPLLSVLANMEHIGVKIDINFLRKLSSDFQKDMNQLQQEIYAMSGEVFNLNSPKQVSKVLFEDMQIEPVSKTKTGLSTSFDVLQKLAKKHPIATKLLEYREISKLKNTYIDTFPELVCAETKRIHTSYNQTITSTGRLSSSKPNLQNIPIRTKRGELIRKAFIAPGADYTLIGADYNQIELRVMAHMAEDRAFIDDFNNGKDIHSQTAMRVYNLTPETFTQDHRRKAKAINFGLIYGMGAYALSENINVSLKEAKELIEIYFNKHCGVKLYMDKTIEFVKKFGYVETLFGRRRNFPSINDKNALVRRNSERAAINAPIQGTSADIIKIAMINISKKLKAFDANMILQIHDELVFEVPKEKAATFSEMLKHEMENVVNLKVKLLVNIVQGNDWLNAH